MTEHWLWNHGCKSLALIMSQITRHMTGVEIHPAAHIGKHFFIDHAMGVIIGETAVVGDNCTLYQASPWAAPARIRESVIRLWGIMCW